jgi:tetratricopeptide (TPR) repeat protein
MNRQERRAAARKSGAASESAIVESLATLHEAALHHIRAGRHAEARLCCQQILARDARHLDTLQLMGLLCLQARQYDDAIEWVGGANREDPAAGYLLSLGTALEQQGLNDEALKAFEKAAKQTPDDAELWTRLANVLVVLQRPAEAISRFERALTVNPRYWLAAKNCAVLLLKLERFEEALAKLDLCNELQPDHAPTLRARAAALHSLDRFEEALSEGRRAQTLDPTNAELCYMIGSSLQKLARREEALDHFDRALELRPNLVAALQNKAVTLSEIQKFDEALLLYRHIKEIDPDNADADWNASLIQLLCGDLEAGWRRREARWKIPSPRGTAGYPKFAQPMWDGAQAIAGKTVLVWADEGLGDTIQFVRYVPMLAALGARVILLPQETLHPLLSELPGVAQCLPNMHRGLPAFDFHCPIMSLPLAFGTTLDTIPAPASYLPRPAVDRMLAFEDRLRAHDKPRIGLVWSGNSQHKNDHNRSMPLQTLSRIIVTGATFVSLQKETRPDDARSLREGTDVVDLAQHLTDFAATAALIACLDLVITVDTSVAHLAAALGCPTWILLPFVPDWRWLLDRDDSPWYPTVHLFRQTTRGNYGGALDSMRTELASLISAKQPFYGTSAQAV